VNGQVGWKGRIAHWVATRKIRALRTRSRTIFTGVPLSLQGKVARKIIKSGRELPGSTI